MFKVARSISNYATQTIQHPQVRARATKAAKAAGEAALDFSTNAVADKRFQNAGKQIVGDSLRELNKKMPSETINEETLNSLIHQGNHFN